MRKRRPYNLGKVGELSNNNIIFFNALLLDMEHIALTDSNVCIVKYYHVFVNINVYLIGLS